MGLELVYLNITTQMWRLVMLHLLICGRLHRYLYFRLVECMYICLFVTLDWVWLFFVIVANDGSLWGTISTVLPSWWSLCSSWCSNGNPPFLLVVTLYQTNVQNLHEYLNRPVLLCVFTTLPGLTTTRSCFSSNIWCKSLPCDVSVWYVHETNEYDGYWIWMYENVCRLQLLWPLMHQLIQLETRIMGSWKNWKSSMDLQCQ